MFNINHDKNESNLKSFTQAKKAGPRKDNMEPTSNVNLSWIIVFMFPNSSLRIPRYLFPSRLIISYIWLSGT